MTAIATISTAGQSCCATMVDVWWLEPGIVGEFYCAPEWHVLPRLLGDYTFWFVRGGVGTLTCAGRDYGLTAGDLLVVPPGVVHAATHDPARPLWVITTHFTVHTHEGVLPSLPSEADPSLHRHLIEPHAFDAYFTRLLALRALQPPEWQAVSSALLLLLLTELRREDAQFTLALTRGCHDHPAIAQALLRLETKGRYFATSGALAKACGFSLGHFCRVFQRQFGCPPQHYLLQRRIDRARQLLLESDLNMRQVAQALGYRDVYFFTRQFKALVGQPPAAFRREARDRT